MKVLRAVALCVLIVDLFCGYSFGQSRKLSDFQKTDFLLTLEHDLNKERNSIYCASFLYAVDKIRKGLQCPVRANDDSKDLTLLFNSTTHQNTLRTGEYKSEVKIGKGRIMANASFQKSLPFKEKLFPGSALQFNGRNVPSFEWSGEGGSVVQILYYKNDGNFTLKLSPSDPEHEIILLMADTIPATLLNMVNIANANIDLGRREREQENLKWKYSMTRDDVVLIPTLSFDIKANYPSIEGQEVFCHQNPYRITAAEQQIAFYLNEKGAEIRSAAFVDVVFAEPVIDMGDQVKPKKMLFDKPFFLMLRRTGATYPYFCMWVANTEHMLN